jgi:uncharacterized membrane protein YbhN (UPF0104 family)
VSRLRRLAPLAGVALFCLALGLLYHELSNVHLSDVLRVLRAIPRERLLLALALTILGYATMTGYDALAIHALGRSLPYRRIALASFLACSVSNTLGHPLFTGTPLRARLYSGWGLSAVEIARIVAFGFLTFWLGFLALAGASFALEPMALPKAIRLPEAGIRPLGVVFLTLAGGWLAVAVLRKKPLTVRGVEVPVPGLPTALVQIALSSLDWLLAAAVLHTLLPPRFDLPFPAFVGCFLLAQLAGILSQVPGGLGVFETTLVLLLPHSGAEALGAVLAFRIVYYLLPVAVALIVLAGYEIGRHVEYSLDLWWRFSLQEHAPRFLRAMVGAAVLVVAVGVVRLLRPVPPRPAPPSTDDLIKGRSPGAPVPAHIRLPVSPWR